MSTAGGGKRSGLMRPDVFTRAEVTGALMRLGLTER
jgi:hypothetical protein